MKKILLPIICYLLFTLQVNSQVRTVSSAAHSPGQYTGSGGLQMAIDSAHVGDTIYVHGGTYDNIIVNKRLTFIGPGYNPQGQFTAGAWIALINLDNHVPSTSARGSKFIGLDIGYIGKLSSNQFQEDSILFERCQFYDNAKSYVLGNYWTFRNNLFMWYGTNAGLSINFKSNILIENNVFSSPAGSTQILESSASSVFIINNLFTGAYSGSAQFSSLSSVTFSNNIFFGKSPYSASSSYFANNIFYGSTYSNSLANGSTGVNNILLDPQFTSVPIDNTMYQFDLSYDYRLKATSPGKNAGSDNTDIGIFGGQHPIPLNNNRMTGEPSIPQVYYMFILNSVIDQYTPINVTIKARKMN